MLNGVSSRMSGWPFPLRPAGSESCFPAAEPHRKQQQRPRQLHLIQPPSRLPPQIEVPASGSHTNHGIRRPGLLTISGSATPSRPVISIASVQSAQPKSPAHISSNSLSVANTALSNTHLVELGKCLLSASRFGEKDEVSLLLSRGAPMTTDWLGTSPLHLAAQYGHTDTAEILLRSGCSKDAKTKVEKTALHLAAQEGHGDMVTLLLRHGCDMDAVDMLKMSPLHWAVERGHMSVVEVLLRFGADVNLESKFNKTPLEIASDNERPDIFELLQNAELLRGSMTMNTLQSDPVTLAATKSISNIEVVAADDAVPEAIHEEVADVTTAAASEAASSSSTRRLKSGPPADAAKLLAEHGITLLPDDNFVPDTDTSKTYTLTEAGRLALSLTSAATPSHIMTAGAKSKTVVTTSSSSSVPKANVTRIVRLAAPSSQPQTVSLATATSTSAPPAPKIIKVTPQQYAALKAGTGKLTAVGSNVVTASTTGLKRSFVTLTGATSSPSTGQKFKIIRVNQSISLASTTSATAAAPVSAVAGVTTTTSSSSSSTKPTAAVRTPVISAVETTEELRKKLEETNRAYNLVKEQLRLKQIETEKLKKALESYKNQKSKLD